MPSATSLPTYGLASIEVATILGDGGIGTSWSTLGYTERGSCKLVEADPDVTSFIPEEIDTPIVEIYKGGVVSLEFNIMDPIATTLETLMGGTASGTYPNTVWTSPSTKTTVDMSLKITPTDGYTVTITKARITAKIDAEFSSKNIMKINVKASVMTPDKAGEPPMTFTES
jgi:hypothetical protein